MTRCSWRGRWSEGGGARAVERGRWSEGGRSKAASKCSGAQRAKAVSQRTVVILKGSTHARRDQRADVRERQGVGRLRAVVARTAGQVTVVVAQHHSRRRVRVLVRRRQHVRGRQPPSEARGGRVGVRAPRGHAGQLGAGVVPALEPPEALGELVRAQPAVAASAELCTQAAERQKTRRHAAGVITSSRW